MLKPTFDNMLVLMQAREETSLGGIVIPEESRGTNRWGEVQAVGPDVRNISVGDTIYIPPHQGTHWRTQGTEGKDFLIVRESEITCAKGTPAIARRILDVKNSEGVTVATA